MRLRNSFAQACAAIYSCVAIAASASAAESEASPYINAQHFITVIAKNADAQIRPTAIIRLQSAHPRIRGRNSIFDSEPLCKKTRGCATTNRWDVYKADWAKLPFTITVADKKYLRSRLEIDANKSAGYGTPISVDPTYNTHFNCGADQIELDLSKTEESEERIKQVTENELDITKETRVKVSVSGKAGVVDASMEAEFKNTVKDRHKDVLEEERKNATTSVTAYKLKLPPMSSVQTGVTPVVRIKNYQVHGRAVYDTDLYAAPHSNLRVKPVYFGKLSEFVDEEDRSLALPAEVSVTTIDIVTTASNPTTYKSTELCEAARDTLILGGTTSSDDDSGSAMSLRSPFRAINSEIIKVDGTSGVSTETPDVSRFVEIAKNAVARVVAADCKGSASGKGKLDGNEVDLSFEVEVQSCPIQDLASNGTIQYSLRVKDEKGRYDIIGPLSSKWFKREGLKFNHGDKASFRDGAISELEEVIDERVIDCTCFER